jgi:hypothetical protein
MCLQHFEKVVNIKKSEKINKHVTKANKTLQIACCFTTKIIRVCYRKGKQQK